MDKQPRKNLYTHEKEQQRVSTAPNIQLAKNLQNTKNNNLQLPHVKGKNVTRQSKRQKKQEIKQHQHKQTYQRPQTSKSRRGQNTHKSDSEDDLYQMTKQQKVDLFKKKMHEYPISINTITFNSNSNTNSHGHAHHLNSKH